MERPFLNIRQVYYYLVCFSTLALMVVGGIKLVGSVVDLVAQPLPTYPTLEEAAFRFSELRKQNPHLTWEDFKQEIEKERQRNQRSEQVRRLRALASDAAMILLPLPAYLYHWRAVRREREEKPLPEGGE